MRVKLIIKNVNFKCHVYNYIDIFFILNIHQIQLLGCACFFTALYISRVHWGFGFFRLGQELKETDWRKAVHRGDEDRHQRSTSQSPSLTAGHFPYLEGQLGSGFWTSKEQAVLAIVSHGCQMCNSQLAIRAVRNDHRCPILRTIEAVLIVWLGVYTVVQIILCHSGALTDWILNKRWIWLSFHPYYNSKSLSPSRNYFFLISCSIRCRHVLHVVR